MDQAITSLSAACPESLHSIYMCGSIPKGMAIPYHSDADLTLVFKTSLSDEVCEKVDKVRLELLERFDLIPKIDLPCCSVDEVLANPLGWGGGGLGVILGPFSKGT